MSYDIVIIGIENIMSHNFPHTLFYYLNKWYFLITGKYFWLFKAFEMAITLLSQKSENF